MATNGTGNEPNGSHPQPPDRAPEQASREKGKGFEERHGRCYDTYRPGHYMFPCDEDAMNTMDIFHKVFLVAREDKLYSERTRQKLEGFQTPKILDIGCGTGIWAVDTADRHWRSGWGGHVEGWDLTLIQPELIPSNAAFFQRDAEEPWFGVPENHFDMIHMRMLAGAIADWSRLYRQAFRHMKPGAVLEQVEFDFQPLNEHDLPPTGTKLLTWSQVLTEAMAKAGRPIVLNPNTKGDLENIGFVNVQRETVPIYFNPWPSVPPNDQLDKERARWFNLGLTHALEGLTLAPLIRMSQWTEDEVKALVHDVKIDICTRALRTKCQMVIITAEKPGTL